MPNFKVTQHTDSDLRGLVSSLTVEVDGRLQTFVSDGALGFLVLDCKVYEGHWHRAEVGWKFVPKKSSGVVPTDSSEFSILDCYWGERVRLVLEESLSWHKQTWTIAGHDHCAICWRSIEALPELKEHYVATGHDDIRFHSTERSCVECYEKHIAKNDTSFVPVFDSSPQG